MNFNILAYPIAVMLAAAPANSYRTAELEAQLKAAEVSVAELTANLYVLFGVGGNIVASIGEQGVLIVDDQYPEMVPRYQAVIHSLGGDNIDFAINTHWHYDHAEGNLVLGPQGTWLVSHSQSRRSMQEKNTINLVREIIEQDAYPDNALPVATFDDRMQFHFNQERIELVHFGPAHTAGDAVVIFRSSNVVHMGDLFSPGGYPFIDFDNGGDFDGLIAFCEAVLKEINSNTVVIPGHGALATFADLEAYVEMLKAIRAKINAMLDQGATLDEVISADITAEWDEKRGNPLRLLDRAYASLVKNRRGRL